MRRTNWPVGAHGVRPAGKPDECFYCHAKVGDQHRTGCVIRTRTVMVLVAVPVLMVVPENWGKDQMEFHWNEGSYCMDNMIETISKQAERLGCLCTYATASYAHEANEADEKTYKLEIEGEPS